MNDDSLLTDPPPHLLIVEDQAEVLELLRARLTERGLRVTAATDADAAWTAFTDPTDPPELVVLDLDLGHGAEEGIELLGHFRKRRDTVPVVILTGNATIHNAVAAFKAGASDFLAKDACLGDKVDLSLRRLGRLLEAIRGNLRLKDHLSVVRQRMARDYRMVGYSEAIRSIRKSVEIFAGSADPVLVVGEPGVGKTVVAAQIHLNRPGPFGPFVTFGTSAGEPDAIPRNLFGNGKPGAIDEADGGTLAIDNIERLDLDAQRRLVERLRLSGSNGANSSQETPMLILASARPLEALRAREAIDPELARAVEGRTIAISPLCERKEDIDALVIHVIDTFLGDCPRPRRPRFSPAAMKKLRAHDWPGNVRELRSVVEQTVYMTRVDPIPPYRIFLPGDTRRSTDFTERMTAYEKRLLVDALVSTNFRQNKAAELLGMTYDQFRHYFKKYDLRRYAEL